MKNLTLPILIAVSLAGLSCKESSNGGPIASPNPQVVSCSNCGNLQQGQPLLESVQAQTLNQEALFSIQIYGTPAAGCMQPTNKQIICAQGNGIMGGIMRVQNGNTFCGIPNGDYMIQPIQVSQLSNAVVLGGQYQAVGPNGARVILQVQSGILYNPSGLDLFSRDNRIGINATISRADGAYCGLLIAN